MNPNSPLFQPWSYRLLLEAGELTSLTDWTTIF